MKEQEEMGLTWGEAQAKARDRSVWRSFVAAFCPRRDEEDECVIELELGIFLKIPFVRINSSRLISYRHTLQPRTNFKCLKWGGEN